MAKANSNIDTSRPDRFPLPATGYALLFAGLAAYGLYALLISGPAMRDAARADLERAIADENRQFCETFGVSPTSAAFTTCSKELTIIRQKQVDRDNAAAQGIL
ncbi:hypothetical protein [Bradyrhizobium cosmicum]|uniref:Uncharacterized protein n=1 Tax=Bradyrhizobium cosmicum TaxID=1404864 RepID=A0AAI8MIC7_9BRAD|nr:hypothetical protein [Bradyrhizobium cosmicum]QDP24482.1 hypothetical protein FNV92_21010 [Bradyrhizobium cosmicum]BAL78720.1 hypothetical protein S23_55280 [Bradyrhizobium cosmicum]